MRKELIQFLYSWKEAVIGIMIAVISILAIETSIRYLKTYIPPTYFFEVHQVFIPNFEVGEDPLIIYEYSVRREFYGSYSVNVQKVYQNGVTELISVCRGSGSKFYKNEQFVLPGEATLSWFINNPNCNLEAGMYQIAITWQIASEGYPIKKYHKVSNIFEVK